MVLQMFKDLSLSDRLNGFQDGLNIMSTNISSFTRVRHARNWQQSQSILSTQILRIMTKNIVLKSSNIFRSKRYLGQGIVNKISKTILLVILASHGSTKKNNFLGRARRIITQKFFVDWRSFGGNETGT